MQAEAARVGVLDGPGTPLCHPMKDWSAYYGTQLTGRAQAIELVHFELLDRGVGCATIMHAAWTLAWGTT